MSISLIDSHCHIPMIDLDGGIQQILDNARQNNVNTMLCVCVELNDFPAILELSMRHDSIYATVGIHPNTEVSNEITISELSTLAQNPRVIAIGETGLDYFRSEGDLNWQRERFRTHIRAAKEVNKPIIVHCREAKEDVIQILKEEKADEVGGVMHCFVEDIETAKKAIDLNFYISFSGIVTFKNALEIKAVAKQIPDPWLLIETDSPYLAPAPFRGRQNQPSYVRHVAEHIAELREVTLEHVAEVTSKNFNRLFIDR
ncbi:MAG: TatD DNase family protein [Gammaproteobacteria bacterium]|jgi:TatD DNase family protein